MAGSVFARFVRGPGLDSRSGHVFDNRSGNERFSSSVTSNVPGEKKAHDTTKTRALDISRTAAELPSHTVDT